MHRASLHADVLQHISILKRSVLGSGLGLGFRV